jgi:hypothetical protein
MASLHHCLDGPQLRGRPACRVEGRSGPNASDSPTALGPAISSAGAPRCAPRRPVHRHRCAHVSRVRGPIPPRPRADSTGTCP